MKLNKNWYQKYNFNTYNLRMDKNLLIEYFKNDIKKMYSILNIIKNLIWFIYASVK